MKTTLLMWFESISWFQGCLDPMNVCSPEDRGCAPMRDRVVGLTCALSCSSSEETSSRHPGTPGLVCTADICQQAVTSTVILSKAPGRQTCYFYPEDLGESLEFEIENLP